MPLVPQEVFLTRGVGRHRNRLQSFELALRKAGIERGNLVRVSSILPPRCCVVPRADGLAKLEPGAITFCVLAEASTNEPSRLVSAGIGLCQAAWPARIRENPLSTRCERPWWATWRAWTRLCQRT
ncbi:MAG: hypothetical protein GXY55_14135 [Phycisphaerae bacterium]|nr:hypothetical protein [Phycisphaerae bacterium]